jgi:hypothetical protein
MGICSFNYLIESAVSATSYFPFFPFHTAAAAPPFHNPSTTHPQPICTPWYTGQQNQQSNQPKQDKLQRQHNG